MVAFYNEIDGWDCQYLVNLMRDNQIAGGIACDTPIQELRSDDLMGYERVHLFAGIGGWDYALRLAGWPDDQPVWTGSCPCQPFSGAGKRKGTQDERHLWPHMYRLICECRPAIVFGEQVASKDALRWLDGVFADMEGEGYACGAADLCAAGVGAPHIRQRLFWVACTGSSPSRHGGRPSEESQAERSQSAAKLTGRGAVGGLAYAQCGADERQRFDVDGAARGTSEEARQRERIRLESRTSSSISGVANSGRSASQWDARRFSSSQAGIDCQGGIDGFGGERFANDGSVGGVGNAHQSRSQGRGLRFRESSAERSPWSDGFTLINCRDGKTRRIGPGISPLAHGIPRGVGQGQPGLRRMAQAARRNRVQRIKGYGNAIVPQVAAVFIRAVMEEIFQD